MNRLKMIRYMFLPAALFVMSIPHALSQEINLSLEDAIEHAKTYNTELINSRLEVQVSQKEVKSIIAQGLPQLNASGQFVHNVQIAAMQFPDFLSPAVYGVLIQEGLLPPDRFQAGEPQTVRFGAPSMLTGQVTLNQLVFDGTYFLGLNAAREYVELSGLMAEQTEIDVVSRVTKSYYLAVLSENIYTMLDSNLKTTREVRDQTKAMLEEGLAEQLDLDRLEFALSSLESRIKSVEMQRSVSKMSLKLMIGMDMTNEISLSTSLNALADKLSEDMSVELELDNRIEYRILEKVLVLDSINVRRYKVGHYPTLTLNANHQQNSFASEAEFVDLGKDWFPGTSYSLNLAIPIFDGFYKKSKIEQARIRQMQDKNKLDNLVNSVQLEVSQAAQNLAVQESNLATQEINRKLARDIFRKTRIKFNEGMGSSFEMVQAENDLYRAEIEYANTMYNLLVAQIELKKALGNL